MSYAHDTYNRWSWSSNLCATASCALLLLCTFALCFDIHTYIHMYIQRIHQIVRHAWLVDMTHLWRQRCSSRIYTHSHWDTFSLSLSPSLSRSVCLSLKHPHAHTRMQTHKHTHTHVHTYLHTLPTIHLEYADTKGKAPCIKTKQNKTKQNKPKLKKRRRAERGQQKNALNVWYFAFPIPVAASDFSRERHKEE